MGGRQLYISARNGPLHLVLGGEQQLQPVRLKVAILLLYLGGGEVDLVRFLVNGPMRRVHRRAVLIFHPQHHLRLQREHVVIGVIGGPDGGAIALRHVEFHVLVGMRDPRFLVEGQAAGLYVDGILQLPGRTLIGLGRAAGIALEIDVDFTARHHRARLRIVFEVGAVNLVEAIRLPAVNHDVDVPKLGPAAIRVLHRIGRANGKQRAPGLRLGERKALRALLDVNPELLRQLLQEAQVLDARVQIEAGDDRDHGQGQQRKPDSKARYGDRHLIHLT